MSLGSFEERFRSLKEVIEDLERHHGEIDDAMGLIRAVGQDLNYVAGVADRLGFGDEAQPHLQALADLFQQFFGQLTFKVSLPRAAEPAYPKLDMDSHPIARKILSRMPLVLGRDPNISFRDAMAIIYFDDGDSKSPNPIIRRFKKPDGTFRLVRLSDEVFHQGRDSWRHSYLYEYLKEAGEFLHRFVNTPPEYRHGNRSFMRWASAIEQDVDLILATLRRWGVELEIDG